MNTCVDVLLDREGEDVLEVERDNPVVVSTIYQTRFYTPSLESGAQHGAFV